jgi:hypothetical protein
MMSISMGNDCLCRLAGTEAWRMRSFCAVKPFTTFLTVVGLVSAFSCSSGGDIVGLNPECNEPEQPTRVSCEEAILLAQAVALSHHVTTEGPKAEVKPEAVAKGQIVPAWWVTFRSAVYHPLSGGSCVPRSYAVIIDAATGRLLAFDDPSPDC